MGQHKFLKAGPHDRQGMTEVHFLTFLVRYLGLGKNVVPGNTQQTGNGDQIEMGLEFLADTTLGLATEIVNFDGVFGDFIQFLNGPALMIKVTDIFGRVKFLIQQGCHQNDIFFALG